LPLAAVFTSVIVIENLLGTPGTGRFFITAARQQDHAVTVGLIVVYSALFIAAQLAVDLVRVWQGGPPIPTVAAQDEAA
jgi:ABC-type dipeptide/oligopeptide/nickel transport system permease component